MMKIIGIALLCVFICTACTEWLDVNTNPNSKQYAGMDELLPSGINGTAFVIGGRYQVLGSLWAQHWTQSPGASQYQGVDAYDINSTSFAGSFQTLYSGPLKDLEIVRKQAQKSKNWNYYLAATVMQAYTYQVLADLYNQVPFSEALQGEDGISAPEYEHGSIVYDSLLLRIDEAVQLFDPFAEYTNMPASADPLFDSNMDYWIKFANILKLKILLRQSFVRPQSQVLIQEMFANDKLAFPQTDIVLNIFTDQSGYRNPVYQSEVVSLGNNPNLVLSTTLEKYLDNAFDDARLNTLFNYPQGRSIHKALPQGDYNPDNEENNINSNSYSKPALSASYPIFLFSLAEIKLLQAEAITRFGVDTYSEAKSLYSEAYQWFYQLHGIPTENNDITGQGGAYEFPSEGSDKETFIKAIAMLKWISLANKQSLEAFFESNRTGYPATTTLSAKSEAYKGGEFTISVNNVTSGRFPKRLIFPESEVSVSGARVPEEKPVWEPIWWDRSLE